VTKNATVAIIAVDGTISILTKGTNEWVCVPGDENGIGGPPMCMNPMGMHRMITWPFDAAANGLPTTVRDAGAWVMFEGTPYSYLHVCGSPWEGNEYHEGDKAVWGMAYVRP
jgi:hypothetical protein